MLRRVSIRICGLLLILLGFQRGIACRKAPPVPPQRPDPRFAPTKVIHYPLPPTPTFVPGKPTPLPDEPQ